MNANDYSGLISANRPCLSAYRFVHKQRTIIHSLQGPRVGSGVTQRPATDVFLSYHWRDRVRVEAIAHWLSTERNVSVFLDRWYLVPGQPWPQALEKALSSCNAVAVCVGAGDLGPWQMREMNLALERQAREPGFPVIPVLLPGADPVLGFLNQNTWIDLREAPDDETLLSALASAARGEPPRPDIRTAMYATRHSVCPYRGLLYFREEDAPFFHGREVTVQHLVASAARNSLTAVVGPSGSGKSSVVRAGLVPALRQRSDVVWEITTIVPGDRPLRAIAAAFVPLLEPEISEVDLLAEVGKLTRAFSEHRTSLRDVAERLLVKQRGTERVLLVVDQWEELYTLTPDSTIRRHFIDLLLEAITHTPLSVVLTLRGDFVGDALGYRPFADSMQGAQVNVGPMTRSELRRVIEAPAGRVDLQFESGLVERITDDVGNEPGNLPLLEFVLKRLWEMRKGPLLLHEAYDHMGKLEGAVASKAESVFATLSDLERAAVRRVFLQLVRPGESRDYTRRRATAEELPDLSSSVVKKLADERLLVTGQMVGIGETTVEVAHEALIGHWDRLRNWLDRDREFLLWRHRLRLLMVEWQRAAETDAVLLHGSLLVEAERWRGERLEELTEGERHYIAESAALHARELEEQRQRREQELAQAQALADAQRQIAEEREQRLGEQTRANRKLRRALAGVSIAVVALLAASAWAWYQTQEAQREEQRAEKMLAASHVKEATVRLSAGSPIEALPFFAAAVRLDPSNVAFRAAALDTLLRTRWVPVSLQHQDDVTSAAFSADGTRLVTASADKTARVWDAGTGQPVGAPLQHQGIVFSAAFNTDGTRVVTASADKTARMWDAAAPIRPSIRRSSRFPGCRSMPTGSSAPKRTRSGSRSMSAITRPSPGGRPFIPPRIASPGRGGNRWSRRASPSRPRAIAFR